MSTCTCHCPIHGKNLHSDFDAITKKTRQRHEKIEVRFSGLNGTGKMPSVEEAALMERDSAIPPWVDMIHDLMEGAGYNYSRIAYRIKCSPSTIQKLATHFDRKPRFTVFHPLMLFHFKIFCGPHATPKAKEYWKKKQEALNEIQFFS